MFNSFPGVSWGGELWVPIVVLWPPTTSLLLSFHPSHPILKPQTLTTSDDGVPFRFSVSSWTIALIITEILLAICPLHAFGILRFLRCCSQPLPSTFNTHDPPEAKVAIQ